MKKLLAPIALAALLLTGCGGPAKHQSYANVNDLAAAYEKAVDGSKCDRTKIDINVNDWVYVTCDGSDFVELFNSDSVRDEVKQKNPLKNGQQRLEGPNWIVVADQYKIAAVQESLGGEITGG